MKNRQTQAGLSIAISETISSFEMGILAIKKSMPAEFKIKVANNLGEREQVFNLAYRMYLEKGYIHQNSIECFVQTYDKNPETVILIVQDQNKKIAGSVTLVFNESSKLPAEKIYDKEISSLKTKGEKLVEISRLVISLDYRNSKEVLLLLMNYLAIYSYHVKKYSSLIIEVNPRHKNYYKTLLGFIEIGTEKVCPWMQNAPAVLLYLPLEKYQMEVNRCTVEFELNKKERTLYSHFLKPEQEKLIAHYLANQVKPITSEEKIYFGFTESGLNRAVCT